jgi:hypothetical protein
MRFNAHPNLIGAHAFLGASKYAWLNYDDARLVQAYNNSMAALRRTHLHEWAAQTIMLGVRQSNSNKTLCRYVNDALKFRMTPEQVLRYSDICFGTADAISFRNNELRIHDLKTGVLPAKMDQLYIYAAMFCLEYGYKPGDINIVTRIYQNDEVIEDNPGSEILVPVMDKMKHSVEVINQLRMEE